MAQLEATHGENDLIFTADGRSFIDVGTSTGAVFVGHANARIRDAVAEQMGRVSSSWTSKFEIQDQCAAAVNRHLPAGYELYSLYSTGSEAVETAIRIAMARTGRSGVLGFRRSFHGKSIALQSIVGGSDIADPLETAVVLPGPPESEDSILKKLEDAVSGEPPAAVVVELVQGQNDGRSFSRAFCDELERVCRDGEIQLIVDEVLTGMYRTGPCLRSTSLGLAPDIVAVGKALGNGFPASGLVIRSGAGPHPRDFRFNSTFSGNPIACAAVKATIEEFEHLDVASRVSEIARRFREFHGIDRAVVRGHGAFAFVDLLDAGRSHAVFMELRSAGVAAIQRGATICLWPPCSITDTHLDHVVRSVVSAAAEHR
ncbi:MAG: aminotransferase class III-fold pyridoxal phosphate-dependent enzyme [Actinomycetota bacterium]